MSDLTDRDRAIWWESRHKNAQDAADYYRTELVKAHALIGRLLHQMSERWDTANLTEFYPTDNLHRKRGIHNPKGEALAAKEKP